MKICSITSNWWFFLSYKLLLAHCTECYKLSMSIMSTIFDVIYKRKKGFMVVYVLSFFLSKWARVKKKYMDLCQHANKYKQVVLETISK